MPKKIVRWKEYDLKKVNFFYNKIHKLLKLTIETIF